MPNWVKTGLSFEGDKEQIKVLRNLVMNGNSSEQVDEFDFNAVIPMPEELNITSGSDGDAGFRYLTLQTANPFSLTDDDRNFVKRFDEYDETRKTKCLELGKKYLMNITKYGHRTWHSWVCENWGTKWNACEPCWVDDHRVKFDTAWSFAYPVVKELARKFPDVKINFIYADEACGSNTGYGWMQGEDEEYRTPECCSDDAYEIYTYVWDCRDEFVKLESGEWKWLDEITDDE